MTQEKNNILDMSSDIVMSGLILSFILLLIDKGFGPKETNIIVLYLASASIWKISSPFSNPTKIGYKMYLWIIALLILMLLIPILIFHL